MGLKKTDEIFKSADPEFNHRAAKAMYDIVMKMDDDAAVVFAETVIADVLEETIEKNLPLFQKRLDEVITKRVQKLSKVLLTKSDNPQAKAYAEALATFSKAKKDWDEDLHPRGAGGRFRTKVSHNQRKPLKSSTAAQLGVGGLSDERYKALSPQAKATYQDEYRQLAQFLRQVQLGSPGDTDVIFTVQDGANNTWLKRTGGDMPKDVLLDPDLRIVAAEARPNTLTAGGAAFSLNSALAPQTMAGMNTVDDKFSGFARDWTETREGDDRNRNARRYRRMETGSRFLGDISAATGNPKLMAAARLGEFVGSHGAEAEAVFGPTARKTAYRYRGTEKKPDEQLVAAYEQNVRAAKARSVAEATSGRRLEPTQLAAQRIMSERRKPTQDEILAARQSIDRHLRSKMPNPKFYNLQLASGNTPPSEGVLLNRDGQIVTQAIGYGDDHYLPFNLKNMKQLKGGEYVRTRSVGGPTSEDIYTGLMMGARRLTVISRSGTFTVTFEDDFRGGRRHNDKARRMTRRYEQILDAVQSEQVDHEEIPTEVRTKIITDVRNNAKDYGTSAEDQRKEIDRKIKEYKENPSLTPEESEVLEARVAAASVGARNDDERRDIRNNIFGAAMARKEFKFKLNGPGYEAALKALEEQFPYYIKTTSNPRFDLEGYSPARDKGYVEPGRNRPTEAAAGLFGARHKGQFTRINGKYSASEADYQDARAGARRPVSETPEKSETDKPEETNRKAKVNAIRRDMELRQSSVQMRDEIKALQESGAFSTPFTPQQNALMSATDQDLTSPENQRVLQSMVNTIVSKAPGALTSDNLRAYRNATGALDRKEFSRDAMNWGKPNLFKDDKAYSEEATYEKKAEEARKRNAPSVRGPKKFIEMSEEEMRQEFQTLAQIHAEFAAGGASRKEMLDNTGALPGSAGLRGLDTDKDVLDRMENLQRVRALKADLDDEDRQKLEGTMVVQHKTPETPEQRQSPQGAQGAINYHVAELTKAAQILEESSDPRDEDDARQLYALADVLSDNEKDFRTAGEVQDILNDDEYKRLRTIAYELASGQRRRRDQGPTGTLRYERGPGGTIRE